MTITVELPPEVEERFRAQARERGVTLTAYVQEYLARSTQGESPAHALSIEDLNRILDEAADLVPPGVVLPDEAMSRASIYAREDKW